MDTNLLTNDKCCMCGETMKPGAVRPTPRFGKCFNEDDDPVLAEFLDEVKQEAPLAWNRMVRTHIRLTKGIHRDAPVAWKPGPLDNFIDTRSPVMRMGTA